MDISGLWGWVPLVGGIAIVVAAGWAITRNKRLSPKAEERSERGTRELREQLDRETDD